MTPILYAKIGGIAALAALLLWTGWHFGGLSKDDELNKYKTVQEAQYAASLKTVADTLNKQIQDGVTARAAQQKVIDAYDTTKNVRDPASVGTAHRVLHLAASSSGAGGCPVPETGAVASGGAHPSGGAGEAAKAQSGLVSLVEADLDDYIAACGRDDKRLLLTQGLAPK